MPCQPALVTRVGVHVCMAACVGWLSVSAGVSMLALLFVLLLVLSYIGVACIDMFSKYAEVVPIKSKQEGEVAAEI